MTNPSNDKKDNLKVVNNIDFSPIYSQEEKTEEFNKDSTQKSLIYNEESNYSRQLTFKRESGIRNLPQPSKPAQAAPSKRSNRQNVRKPGNLDMIKSAYMQTPQHTMKKNKSSYFSTSKKANMSVSSYNSSKRNNKKNKSKNKTKEFISKSKKNIFFYEDNSHSNSKNTEKNKDHNEEFKIKVMPPFNQKNLIEYDTLPSKPKSQITSIKHKKKFRKRKKQSMMNTENHFYSNINNSMNGENPQMKKNSSVKYFPKMFDTQETTEERMTAPSTNNPLSNIYMPKAENFFPTNVPQNGEIVFISKKDSQVYKLQNVKGHQGQNKGVFVNIRDKSVKNLKKISSVKSFTSNNGATSIHKKKKRKKKKKPSVHVYQNQNASTSMYNNNVTDVNRKQKKRASAFIVNDSKEAITLPSKYTLPQQIMSSSRDLTEEVTYPLLT